MFRRQLRRNIRRKLRTFGREWPVEDAVGLFTIHLPSGVVGDELSRIVRGLQEVSGIVWITCARRLRPYRFTPDSREDDMAELTGHLLEMAAAAYSPGKTFAVRVNRGNKRLPFASPELASELGREIRAKTGWDKVDLKRPDVTFHLDLRSAASFVFGEKLRGPGGLPVGTSGRVLALLSGGIDSPVAAYLMAKRGCRVDFVHFTAAPVTREEILQSKIWRLAQQVARYTLGSRLFVVPYVHFDLALMHAKVGYELVLFRRFMMRVAERIARENRARALVTGDNLSQVASQTMSNLISASEACAMQVLRPILAFDKEETIAIAQRIGTYPISIEAYKDCCALISGKPKTRSMAERLARLEVQAFPDYKELIERTVADLICLEVDGFPESGAQPNDDAEVLQSHR
jgi:thiamine biosynthesis protein ThiI